MRTRIHILILSVFLLVIALPVLPVSAAPNHTPNGYDVIAAVNAMRAANGLPALQADNALMSSAQGHSDYQASIGTWTHEGPGGTHPKDRAMAAGYGGGATVFVSENVAELSTNGTLEYLIYTIWSDTIHWNTMINPQYVHAGAGVTVGSNGLVYYTLDVGYIAGNPAAYTPGPSYTPGVGTLQPRGGTPTNSQIIMDVITATPGTDGTISHTVEQGQSLWSIAIAYGTTINEIVALNQLDPANPVVWAGQTLIIRIAFTPTVSPLPSETVPFLTATPRPTSTPRPLLPTRTITPTLTETPKSFIPSSLSLQTMDQRTMGIAIISICGLGLVIVAISGFRKRR